MIAEFQFGEWLPDAADYKNPGLEVCENVIPKPDGYSPARAAEPTGDSVTGTVIGVYPYSRLGGVKGIVVATTDDLYIILNGTTTASGLSLGASSDDRFVFSQFNSLLYATCKGIGTYNLSDIETDLTFSASTGSPPTANAMGRVGDFLVMGDMIDINASNRPSALRWSRFNDPGGTWGAEIAYQSGSIDLGPEQGRVMHISGRDYGLIFQEYGISRITYTGGKTVFAKELFEKNRGTPAPHSVVRIGRMAYFMSHDGFFVTDGAQVTSISRGRIWEWVRGIVNTSFAQYVQGAVDWPNRCIVWTIPTGDAGDMTHQLYFNWESGRWSVVERDVDFVFSSGRSAETLESLAVDHPDLDAMTVSLDSPLWDKGERALQGLLNGEVQSLEGSPLLALFESGSFQPETGKRAFVRAVTPLIQNDTFNTTVSIGTRDQMTSTPIFSDNTTIGPLGYAAVNADGRYHRVRVSIPTASEWSDASGFQVEFEVSGAY